MDKQKNKAIAKDLKKALDKNGIIITDFDYSVNNATGDITAFVTSASFASKDEYERQELIWDAIKKEVPKEEYIHISGVITLTPQEEAQFKK
jgi:acid stress-induced BolA-like protein IbaG/YrbA